MMRVAQVMTSVILIVAGMATSKHVAALVLVLLGCVLFLDALTSSDVAKP